jgi:hypothetical protein
MDDVKLKRMIISLKDYPANSRNFLGIIKQAQKRIFSLKSRAKSSETFGKRTKLELKAESLNELLTKTLCKFN